MTTAQLSQVIVFYKQGMSVRKIAREVGVSKTVVHRAIQDYKKQLAIRAVAARAAAVAKAAAVPSADEIFVDLIKARDQRLNGQKNVTQNKTPYQQSIPKLDVYPEGVLEKKVPWMLIAIGIVFFILIIWMFFWRKKL